METSAEDRLADDELIAQMRSGVKYFGAVMPLTVHSTLVFGATDTTSNTLSRIFYLLALHPDVQERLRADIVQARQGERLSYDELMALPYLDAICRETLRA